MRKQLLNQGAEPLSGTPEDLAAYLMRELDKYGKIIREAGVKAEGGTGFPVFPPS